MTDSPWPAGAGVLRQVDLTDLREALFGICEAAWRGRGVRVYVSVAYGRAALVTPGDRSDERLQATCSSLLMGTYTRGVLEREVAADLGEMLAESAAPVGAAGAPLRPGGRRRTGAGMGARWTERDDAVIADLYGAGGSLAVQAMLPDRSIAAIQVRASLLGVPGPGRKRRAKA